ncbi:hypothetical protein [Aquidulcibacter sp.]|uniref:hypothetical protein n=1 Tax=Aquidulcibacter sp. TaxID=2052990 RepID=UPI000BCD06FF|nr:MAG: hypothetical protein CFE27_09205 [Alphaproteobacteria bacterium PA1]HCP65731.1 hypothetical protein [Hyphomonadaceae bacterium]
MTARGKPLVLGLMLGIGLAGLVGCRPAKEASATAEAQVEARPDATATADVDRRATLALKQDLVTRFPQNSPTAKVEAGLIKDGYSCGPNPMKADERACLKAVRKGACEENTIVRSKPYLPEKAQFIRICEIAK